MGVFHFSALENMVGSIFNIYTFDFRNPQPWITQYSVFEAFYIQCEDPRCLLSKTCFSLSKNEGGDSQEGTAASTGDKLTVV